MTLFFVLGSLFLVLMDIELALEHLRIADPIIAMLIDRVGDYTLRYEPQGFAALVSAIISQQISVKAATQKITGERTSPVGPNR